MKINTNKFSKIQRIINILSMLLIMFLTIIL